MEYPITNEFCVICLENTDHATYHATYHATLACISLIDSKKCFCINVICNNCILDTEYSKDSDWLCSYNCLLNYLKYNQYNHLNFDPFDNICESSIPYKQQQEEFRKILILNINQFFPNVISNIVALYT